MGPNQGEAGLRLDFPRDFKLYLRKLKAAQKKTLYVIYRWTGYLVYKLSVFVYSQ